MEEREVAAASTCRLTVPHHRAERSALSPYTFRRTSGELPRGFRNCEDNDVATAEPNVTPPDSLAMAPEPDVTPPEPDVTPPDRDAEPPDCSAAVPDCYAAAADSDATPPESHVTPPDSDVTAPDSNAVPPDSDAVPPDCNVTVPDCDVMPPESDAVTADSNVMAPDCYAVPPDCNKGARQCTKRREFLVQIARSSAMPAKVCVVGSVPKLNLTCQRSTPARGPALTFSRVRRDDRTSRNGLTLDACGRVRL